MSRLTHVLVTARSPEDFMDEEPEAEEGAAEAEAGDDDEAPTAEPRAPGGPFAALLSDGLVHRGWELVGRWQTPYGQAFDVRRPGGQRYDVEVAPLDADAGRWLAWALPRAGLFRRGHAKDPEVYDLLLLHLAEILEREPRIAERGWSTEAQAPKVSAAS